MNHPMDSQIEEYAGGSLPAGMSHEIESHLNGCPSCRAKVASMRLLEHSLRDLPLEEPGAGFTERVLRRLGLAEGGSLAWRIITNLAPLMSLFLIGIILYIAMNLAGTLGTPQVQSSLDSINAVYRGLGDNISQGINAFRSFTAQNLPFLANHESRGMVLFLVLLFAGVALIDRYLVMPLMTRRRL